MISGVKTTDGSMVLPSDPSEVASNEVIQLREWGTDCVYMLPEPPLSDRLSDPPPEWVVGTAEGCVVRLIDPSVLPRHAQLDYYRHQWWIRALGNAAGLREDGTPRGEFALVPGAEISVGPTTLIAESPRSIALRDFCARLLGWGDDHMPAVDHALRAIRLAVACRSPLILRGEGDLVPIAYALHRHTLGVGAPFVVCDRRRQTVEASVRSLANEERGVVAFKAAAGGSLCMKSQLPHDFAELLARLHEPDSRVELIVCPSRNDHRNCFAAPVPICVPPLRERAVELQRIVEEYAAEAIAALRPVRPEERFTADDLQWLLTARRRRSRRSKRPPCASWRSGRRRTSALLLHGSAWRRSHWLGGSIAARNYGQ